MIAKVVQQMLLQTWLNSHGITFTLNSYLVEHNIYQTPRLYILLLKWNPSIAAILGEQHFDRYIQWNSSISATGRWGTTFWPLYRGSLYLRGCFVFIWDLGAWPLYKGGLYSGVAVTMPLRGPEGFHCIYTWLHLVTYCVDLYQSPYTHWLHTPLPSPLPPPHTHNTRHSNNTELCMVASMPHTSTLEKSLNNN